ncbi:DUF1905 domain-containing protein [Actinotalea sp. K2]|uniref:DUF1905 domain-containing protein n=1 Tax=Actinotalea sp. K2 TaxID=2939438 RepID=UPI0020176337|nr:DUF1905 domain-containing protein [Actinotalea sp. K2]MCL3859646.1 DUF1905 domain-containing protein [Actinotalea sp. K2]
MTHPTYRFTTTLWQTEGVGPWVMLTVPFEQADAIDEVSQGQRHGFGSVRVEVRIGTTTWRTSLFPDRRRKSFVMGVKRAVRDAEGLDVGDTAEVEVTLLEVTVTPPSAPSPPRSRPSSPTP